MLTCLAFLRAQRYARARGSPNYHTLFFYKSEEAQKKLNSAEIRTRFRTRRSAKRCRGSIAPFPPQFTWGTVRSASTQHEILRRSPSGHIGANELHAAGNRGELGWRFEVGWQIMPDDWRLSKGGLIDDFLMLNEYSLLLIVNWRLSTGVNKRLWSLSNDD